MTRLKHFSSTSCVLSLCPFLSPSLSLYKTIFFFCFSFGKNLYTIFHHFFVLLFLLLNGPVCARFLLLHCFSSSLKILFSPLFSLCSIDFCLCVCVRVCQAIRLKKYKSQFGQINKNRSILFFCSLTARRDICRRKSRSESFFVERSFFFDSRRKILDERSLFLLVEFRSLKEVVLGSKENMAKQRRFQRTKISSRLV